MALCQWPAFFHNTLHSFTAQYNDGIWQDHETIKLSLLPAKSRAVLHQATTDAQQQSYCKQCHMCCSLHAVQHHAMVVQRVHFEFHSIKSFAAAAAYSALF